MNIIRLNNIRLYAYHGCLPEEKKLGQRFEIDVELSVEDRISQGFDKVKDTVDYTKVYHLVKDEFQRISFNLIETAAHKICDVLLTMDKVQVVTIRIRKPHAPIEGHFSDIEVEVSKKR